MASRLGAWLGLATVTALVGLGCSADTCDFDSDCRDGLRCISRQCRLECRSSADCEGGASCTEGRCAAPSDGGIDSGLPDAPDSGNDSGGMDSGTRDAAAPSDGGPRDTGAEIDAEPPDAGGDPGDTGADAGMADAGADAPVGRGSYLYRRIPVGGLNEATQVAFHPDGTYALVLERNNEVHVFDWATETTVQIDLRVAGRSVRLEDVHFDPSGAYAYLVGYETSPEAGVIVRFDDATWRSASDATAFTRLSERRAGERFTAIEFPEPGDSPAGDGRPVVLSASGSASYIGRLRELDPAADTFEGLFVAQAMSSSADDLAFVDNEFGTWGIVIVAGPSGADTKYYTEIAGVPEWRPAPAATLGNVSRAAAHPSTDYVLAIGTSGRRAHRFEAGTWGPASSAPRFATQGVFDVSFAPDGQRALIVGRTSVGRGTVIEYRHDLYSEIDMTDVSISGFEGPPYNATSNTYLNDSAFRPGCDGGLIVGGEVSAGTGMLIEFQIEAARACR